MFKYKYEDLLERAYSMLKGKITLTTERFQIPRVNVTYIKNKTVLLNAKDIIDIFRRDIKHFSKFLQKEFGVPTIIEGGRIVLSKKVPERIMQKKVEEYAKEFVICPICGKPDTKIIKKERGILYLKCEACGAESPIRYVL